MQEICSHCLFLILLQKGYVWSLKTKQPPFYSSTCISRHLQLRTRWFCWHKVLLATWPCWHQPAHSDYREDTGSSTQQHYVHSLCTLLFDFMEVYHYSAEGIFHNTAPLLHISKDVYNKRKLIHTVLCHVVNHTVCSLCACQGSYRWLLVLA